GPAGPSGSSSELADDKLRIPVIQSEFKETLDHAMDRAVCITAFPADLDYFRGADAGGPRGAQKGSQRFAGGAMGVYVADQPNLRFDPGRQALQRQAGRFLAEGD